MLETAAKAYELAKKAGSIEAQEVIMQLREELLAKQLELRALRADNESLKHEREVNRQLKYEEPYYWRELREGCEGPYCQLCYDRETKLIRLQRMERQGSWQCHACDKLYFDKYHTPHDGSAQIDGVSW